VVTLITFRNLAITELAAEHLTKPLAEFFDKQE